MDRATFLRRSGSSLFPRRFPCLFATTFESRRGFVLSPDVRRQMPDANSGDGQYIGMPRLRSFVVRPRDVRAPSDDKDRATRYRSRARAAPLPSVPFLSFLSFPLTRTSFFKCRLESVSPGRPLSSTEGKDRNDF